MRKKKDKIEEPPVCNAPIWYRVIVNDRKYEPDHYYVNVHGILDDPDNITVEQAKTLAIKIAEIIKDTSTSTHYSFPMGIQILGLSEFDEPIATFFITLQYKPVVSRHNVLTFLPGEALKYE